MKRLSAVSFLIIVLICNISFNIAKAQDIDNVRLTIDLVSYAGSLPRNFRKTSDISNLKFNKSIETKGLEKLEISGSEQFLERNFQIMIDEINTRKNVVIIDLREESHGFINGISVSFTNRYNNANEGLSRALVIEQEKNSLKSIPLNTKITVEGVINSTIVPVKVETEEQFVKAKGKAYERIPVTDFKIPTDEDVDYFVNLVNNRPENSWFHFHCKAGIGRTTIMMTMYDIMQNYKDLTMEQMFKRQIALAGFDENITNELLYRSDRIGFLQSFYNYCKANGDSYNITYTEWKSKNT